MPDTTMMIQRRVRHWRTTLAGIASIACPVVALFVPPEWAVKVLGISAVLSGAGLLAAADGSAVDKARAAVTSILKN